MAFRFLQGDGGNNFVWSLDNKSVIYDSTLGLTEWSLEKTIEVATGEAAVTETCEKYEEKGMDSKDACYRVVAREKNDESVCAQIGLPETRSDCYLELAKLKDDFDICRDNHLTAALGSDCAEYFGRIDKGGTVGGSMPDMEG